MRLIDGDTLINRIVFCTGLSQDVKELVEDEIENAPTIPQWISCSERLPMMGEYVLTYRPTMGMRMIVDAYEGYYGEDDIDEWHEGWVYGGDKVVAWMPLPEPYREEGEA